MVNIDKVTRTLKKTNKLAYQKLMFWYEEIKNYEQLGLKEAKELNRLMLESNGEDRCKYREKLIKGTLFLVYYFVCKSGYTAIKSSDFDINDIMNTSIEIWINMLDSGVLLRDSVNDFACLFLKEFYIRINTTLLGKERLKYFWYEDSYAQLARGNFGKILEKYIDCIRNNMITDEKDCYDCILECLEQLGILESLNYQEISQIYLIFYKITRSLNISDISKISITNLDHLKTIFFDMSLYDRNKEVSDNGEIIDGVNKKIIFSRIRQDIIDEDYLTTKQKKTLIEKFGFNGDYKTNIALAEQLGISPQAVSQSLEGSFRKLRKIPLMKSMYFDYD